MFAMISGYELRVRNCELGRLAFFFAARARAEGLAKGVPASPFGLGLGLKAAFSQGLRLGLERRDGLAALALGRLHVPAGEGARGRQDSSNRSGSPGEGAGAYRSSF
jgi:hypothetical protein